MPVTEGHCCIVDKSASSGMACKEMHKAYLQTQMLFFRLNE